MTAAQYAVIRRLKELHISCDPGIIADLFDIIPAAAGNFGCENWSTPLFGTYESVTKCKLQQYQSSVYKPRLTKKKECVQTGPGMEFLALLATCLH
jgi:hypothetical protein